MKLLKKKGPALFLILLVVLSLTVPALAASSTDTAAAPAAAETAQTQSDATGSKSIAAGIAIGLAAAGGQCCRCRSNAADLQKRAAGDLFHHINILSHIFGKQYCAGAAAQCCLSDSYTSHRHIPQELRRLRPVRTGLCAEFP